jgi:hypothetical protein
LGRTNSEDLRAYEREKKKKRKPKHRVPVTLGLQVRRKDTTCGGKPSLTMQRFKGLEKGDPPER